MAREKGSGGKNRSRRKWASKKNQEAAQSDALNGQRPPSAGNVLTALGNTQKPLLYLLHLTLPAVSFLPVELYTLDYLENDNKAHTNHTQMFFAKASDNLVMP